MTTMRKLLSLFMLIATIACSQKKGKDSNSDLFGAGEKIVELDNKKLQELSGLAASAANKGMLWTHNDSGNGNEIFLVDQNLNIKLTCKLKDVINRDWEDIAVGPGPEKGVNYIYVAEIGDNMAIFPYKNIYRFREPKVGKEKEITISDFDTIVFKLADKRKDTEALAVHPVTKNIYVVSKRENPVHVYEIPYPYSVKDTLTAQSVATVPYSQVVAADFSVDGKEFIMKNYDNIFYWNVGSSSLINALKKSPAILEYKPEPQGESLTFARDGSGFFTISEMVKGEKSFLLFYPRKK
jgi:hypothetical protein